MLPERQLQGAELFLDRDVNTCDGHKVGVSQRLIENRVTEVPEWIAVEAGLFGREHLLVPLAGAKRDEDTIMLPYPKEVIESAPPVDPDGLSPGQEDLRSRHSGLGSHGPPPTC